MKTRSEKKDGGTIRNWQLHHLTLPEGEGMEEEFLKHRPGVLLDPGPVAPWRSYEIVFCGGH